VKDALHRWSG